MNLSVVIPAYNEEDNIKEAVLDVFKRFPKAEIIVVNDTSTDNTLPILNVLTSVVPNLRVLTNSQNRGHGYSVTRGLWEANGEYILYIDADRQIELDHVIEGFDFVSGYRFHRNDKLFRKVISFFLKMTILFRFGYYIKDSNCPFKIYKREVLRPLLEELPHSNIVPVACLEVLARRHGLLTATIPTPHYPYQGERKGFLQSFNVKMYIFLAKAFWEIVRI